jgi:hypothetical protein
MVLSHRDHFTFTRCGAVVRLLFGSERDEVVMLTSPSQNVFGSPIKCKPWLVVIIPERIVRMGDVLRSIVHEPSACMRHSIGGCCYKLFPRNVCNERIIERLWPPSEYITWSSNRSLYRFVTNDTLRTELVDLSPRDKICHCDLQLVYDAGVQHGAYLGKSKEQFLWLCLSTPVPGIEPWPSSPQMNTHYGCYNYNFYNL